MCRVLVFYVTEHSHTQKVTQGPDFSKRPMHHVPKRFLGKRRNSQGTLEVSFCFIHVHLRAHAHLCRCPRGPEEDIESPGLEFTGGCELLSVAGWNWGTELGFSAGAASVLKHSALSPALRTGELRCSRVHIIHYRKWVLYHSQSLKSMI